MATPIRLKRSAVAGRIPAISDLQLGELALNFYDGKLYVKQKRGESESIVEIGANLSSLNITTGISTIGGEKLDINTLTDINNVRFPSDQPSKITTRDGELVLASGEGIVTVESNRLNVTGIASISQNLEVTGSATFGGALTVSGQFNVGNISASTSGIFGDIQISSNQIDSTNGNLVLDSSSGTVLINDNLEVQDSLFVNQNLDVTQNILSAGYADIKDVRIGFSTSNEIDTASGILILDSDAGYVFVDDGLEVAGISTFSSPVFLNQDLTVVGFSTFAGAEFSGGLSAKNVNIGAITDPNLIFGESGDLKLSSQQYRVRVNSDAYLQRNLQVAGISTFNGRFDLNGSAYLNDVEVGVARSTLITTTHSDLELDSATNEVHILSNLTISGITTIESTLNVANSLVASQFATNSDEQYGITIDTSIRGPEQLIIDPYPHGNTAGSVRVLGDFYVDGTQFIVDSEIIQLRDFQIGIATDITSNNLLSGAGIGIGGTEVLKTLTYDNASDSFLSSENINIPAGKVYKIDGSEVLSQEKVSVDHIVASGLSTVGFLTATGALYGLFDGNLNVLGNTYYVASTGSDTESGNNINQPFRTLAHALSVATNGDIINVSAGIFEEVCPLTVPAGVTIRGAGLRATTIRPTAETNTNDIFKLNNLSTVEDITIKGSLYDNVNDTGYAFSYAVGAAITNRSPYIQRVTVLNRGSVVTSDDPYGYDIANAGRGAKVDGSLVASNSIEAGMLFNEVTFFTPNQKGIILTNGARAEYLNCFHYFASEAVTGVAGTTGIGGNANARIRVEGLSLTPSASNIIRLYSGGVGIATGTVVSHDSGLVTISGLGEGTFTSVGVGNTQDIRVFLSDGVTQVGTGDTITFADYKMFGAEIRSVGCAFEYGQIGVVADGIGVQLRLFAANFNHVGSGKDFTNDDTLVQQSNEVIELNGGQVSYVSIDQRGDFRVGESFIVDQEAGNVAFAATSNLSITGDLEITDSNSVGVATLTSTSLRIADLQLDTNTVQSLVGSLTLTGESGVEVSGIATFSDKVIFDSTNSIQIPAGTTAERDSVGTAVTGQIRYNTTNSSFEGYGPGGDWGSLGGVKDVNQDTYILPESSPGSNEDILYFYNNGNNTATISETDAQFNTNINATGVVTATTFYGEGGALTLGGNISDKPTDNSYITGGALNTFGASTKIVDSVDELNELAFNIIRNTAVSEVNFTATPQVGGSPLQISLAITHSGNANRYDVDWGDGTQSLNQSVSNLAHTYNQPNGAQNTITVTARNSNGVGAGHSQTFIRPSYITIYTPDPVVDFDFYSASSGGSALSLWDDASTVYLENTTSNVTGFAVDYSINYGDGDTDAIESNAVPGGVGGGRTEHTFTNATETDTIYTVVTTLNTHPAADPAVIPTSRTKTFKVYSEHTPSISGLTTIGINSESNSGYPVTLTNTTESSIGSYADFDIRYRYVWGDGDIQFVNVGTGGAGDTGNTISHTYDLTDNSAGISSTYIAKLQVFSQHSNSPFESAEFEVLVEPEVRSIFTGIATVVSDRIGDDGRDLYKGTDLFGRDRGVAVFTNNSHNATDYVWQWGDSSPDDVVPDNVSAGGTLAQIYHTFDYSGIANKTVTLTANGQPGHIVQNGRTSTLVFTLNNIPSAPTGITASNLSMFTSSQGVNPYLCAGATRNESGVGIETGSSVRRIASAVNVITNYLNDINGSHTGTLSAQLNGSGIGTQTFTTATGETGTFGDLEIASEGDAHDEISASTYPTGFFQCFTARIIKPFSEIPVGLSDYGLVHSTLGSCGLTTFLKDDLNTTPTLTTGTLSESSGGTKRYISGIPYYDSGGPTLTLSGVQVTNFTGQTYQNTLTPVDIAAGNAYESTSGNVISTQYYTYSEVDGASTFIDPTYNVPNANTGVSSPYTLGSLSIPLTSSNIRTVQDLKIRAKNSVGTGSYATNSTKVQVHTAAQSGISEVSIAVADALGNGVYTDDAVRIFDFSAATTDTPSFTGSTNFYTNSPYTEASDPGVAGTKEATIRIGVLKHDTTDYSTGYLPVGPDRSGDTGTQYFTFAFRRQVVANFDINITSSTGVAGVWIAAPGTQTDTTSGLNGWLRADTPYAGSGVPGSGGGGNGSDGCAANSGDRILPSTALSGGYTMTLGSENMSNATGNVVLVRIALTSGQSITNLSVGEAN